VSSTICTRCERIPEGARQAEGEDFERWHSAGEFSVTLSAVLLAGGLSRRMGRDKAALGIGADPL
jgi:hypothetical protein